MRNTLIMADQTFNFLYAVFPESNTKYPKEIVSVNIVNLTKTENGILSISINGRIDSTNAADVENCLFLHIKENHAQGAVIDAENLEYVSSAGLRVILKLKKSLKQFKIVNVSGMLYEIFDTTGFTSIMDIQKALRKISLEGCEFLGKGVHGAVYQIDSETIVKVYLDGSSFERISDEMNRAKNAFISGIPTAISYDVVDCGDGHLGVVYEMMNGTLSKYLLDNPDKFDECARKYAELLKTLHQIDTDEEIFGNFRDGFLSLTEKLRADLGDERTNKLIELINAVPHSKTIIHGDCHPNNIMVQNDELLLIDMADIGYGNPIFEWGAIHQCLLSIKEDKCKQTIGIELSDSIKLFDKVLRYYLNTDDEQKIKNFIDICVPFNLLRMVFLMESGLDNTDDVKAIAFSIADQFLFSNMDHYILMAKNLPTSFIS